MFLLHLFQTGKWEVRALPDQAGSPAWVWKQFIAVTLNLDICLRGNMFTAC